MTDPSLPPLSTGGWLRWAWNTLTSMRTALILLFLLAVAAVPGSIFPQRGVNPIKTKDWIAGSPTWGPIFDRLGFFEVYSSPWFSAIYLLLFISLIGCVLPRIITHWRAMRSVPPAAPRNLSRMQDHGVIDDAAPQPVERAAEYLRRKHWRVRTGETDGTTWVSAEKGYLRETGNLLFHVSLLGLLVAVAIGGLFGWKGNVIVRSGQGFSDTLTQYDAWGGGRFANSADLPPFSFTLDQFDVQFERDSTQRGAPRLFRGQVTYRTSPDAQPQTGVIEVNHPLEVDGAKVFLVGHGYAPHFIVRNDKGEVIFDDNVVTLPQDGNFTSTGVIKIPDTDPQLGFDVVFYPTFTSGSIMSSFPAPDNPAVYMALYKGDLGLDTGVPQSVYKLDKTRMEMIARVPTVTPGQMWTVKGIGSIQFVGYERWASFQIAHDPGKEWALAAAILAIAGLLLSLLVRRRRVWVKVSGDTVEIAGLNRLEGGEMGDDLVDLAKELRTSDTEKP